MHDDDVKNLSSKKDGTTTESSGEKEKENPIKDQLRKTEGFDEQEKLLKPKDEKSKDEKPVEEKAPSVPRAEVVFARLGEKDLVKAPGATVTSAVGPILADYVKQVPYNSLEDAVAFLEHLEKERKVEGKEGTTPQEAFKGYQTDSMAPIKKGVGGQCVGQGIDIAEQVAKLTSYPAYAVAAQFPNRKGDKIHTHGAAMVAFANPEDKKDQGYVLLDPGFNVAEPIVVKRELPAKVRSSIYGLEDGGTEGSEEIVSRNKDSKEEVTRFPANDKPTNPEAISKMALLTYQSFNLVNRSSRDKKVLQVDLKKDQFKLSFEGKKKVEVIVSTTDLEEAKKKITETVTDEVATLFGYESGEALCASVFRVLDGKKDILSLQSSAITD